MTHTRFDIAVIGAGAGGLTVAAAAARLGQQVVLFERSTMGGDCLNTGCVPSKALLAAAGRAQAMRQARQLGITPVEPEIDFQAVQRHVHGVIDAIAPHDSAERFEALGVSVVAAEARFLDTRTLEADGRQFTARRVVIATGSRPAVPDIPGLADVPYLTNETIFSITELPRHLIIIGAGPMGLELAQAHRRLGARVSVVDSGEALSRDDPELAAPVLAALAEEEVRITSGASISRISREGEEISVHLADGSAISGSHLLLAAGRRPNVESLALERAGIAVSAKGITVNPGLRTTNRRVYAVGDVAGGHFTHEAAHQAGIVIRNAVFGLPARNRAAIAHVTYTDPELAQVGLTEAAARARHGSGVQVLRWPFSSNDRALAEASSTGLVKIITGRRGIILGAGIVGRHAGELIQPWVLAVDRGLKIGAMISPVLPYPTRGEAGRRAALEYFSALASNPLLRAVIRVVKFMSP